MTTGQTRRDAPIRITCWLNILVISALMLASFSSCGQESKKKEKQTNPIDRFQLVNRHNVILHEVDTLGSLSVGNGEFAFTVDASGLQTFPAAYENGIPPGTMAQWAWHSMPDAKQFSLSDVNIDFQSCDGSSAPYPVQHTKGKAADATNALRANPHRLHLGLIGLKLLNANGERATLADLSDIEQKLDLWTGKIDTRYIFEGTPVRIELYAHQLHDQISVRITSPLIARKKLGVEITFPYGKTCHVCPGYDFENEEKHSSELKTGRNNAVVSRTVDSTKYFVGISWTKGTLSKSGNHRFMLQPSADVFEFSVRFAKEDGTLPANFESTQKNSREHWEQFWMRGGVVDFSECTDERAAELERRVVLSQYLTKIQCAGSLPPQETGLTMNSWYGKFHMEMYWWHGAHFPLWGRPELLERSMQWYQTNLAKASATATRQGYRGARWQKMTDPYGNESPSDIGAFIIWQQPHPIYLANLLYRSNPNQAVLEKYKEIVFSTAGFMVSFLKNKNGQYHLCHPLIPAQEIFKATETDDPAFELQYWYYGLTVAQQWRTMLGLPRDPDWDRAIDRLAPLPVKDGMYLPNATTPLAYRDNQFRKDHPAVLGALGFLPGNTRIDSVVMGNTLQEILREWDWESTWGWDYPLVAMTATRLYQPENAIEALLMETQKNTYLINGHNYQDKRLRLYLPGNGGLLAAIALMTAGWDGNETENPGFPKNGKWNVRWEGLQRMP